MSVDELVRYLRERVPLTRSIDLRPGIATVPGELVLEAPLAANHNDKGTAFAGTLATLSTLSGWAMTRLICAEAGYQVDIAVTRSEIEYLAPFVDDPVRVCCERPGSAAVDRLLAALGARGRGSIEVQAYAASADGGRAVTYHGKYHARVITGSAEQRSVEAVPAP